MKITRLSANKALSVNNGGKMIQIDDYDLPITAAQKIITGTRPSTASELAKTVAKCFTGIDGAGDTEDMFTLDEISEIADYLHVYCDTHKNGD